MTDTTIDVTDYPAHFVRDCKAVEAALAPLVGGTVTFAGPSVAPATEFDPATVFPTLEITTATGDTLVVTVLSDPEGNGAGHLAIEPA